MVLAKDPDHEARAAVTSVDDAVRGAAFGELSEFREELYRCLRRRSDALFELSDACCVPMRR